MITKFEKTGEWSVMLGRLKKQISNETVEEVAFAMVERESDSQYSSSNAQAISHDLSLPWSVARKILRSVLKWYPYKINFVQEL